MLRKIARLVMVVCLVIGIATIKMGCDCECVGESTPCKTFIDTQATCKVYDPLADPFCAGCQTTYTATTTGYYYNSCVETGVGFVNGGPCYTCDDVCTETCGGQKWISDVICSEKPTNPVDLCVTKCFYRKG